MRRATETKSAGAARADPGDRPSYKLSSAILPFKDYGTHVRAQRTTQRSPEKTHHNSSSLSASAATADTKSFPPAQLTFVKPGDISASNGIIPCEICEIECPQTFGVSAASLSKFRRIIPQILCAFSLWGQAQHNWGHYRLDLKYAFVTLAIWILDVFE